MPMQDELFCSFFLPAEMFIRSFTSDDDCLSWVVNQHNCLSLGSFKSFTMRSAAFKSFSLKLFSTAMQKSPARFADSTPATLSSMTMQSFGLILSCLTTSLYISGSGLGFLTCSLVMMISKYFLRDFNETSASGAVEDEARPSLYFSFAYLRKSSVPGNGFTFFRVCMTMARFSSAHSLMGQVRPRVLQMDSMLSSTAKPNAFCNSSLVGMIPLLLRSFSNALR